MKDINKSEIEIIAIRSYPHNASVPDEVVAHLDEDEMRACFENALELDLFKIRDELIARLIGQFNLALSKANEDKRFYKSKRLTTEQYLKIAEEALSSMMLEAYLKIGKKNFDRMLKTIKTRTRVRVKP
jgi:hypothetical protein